MPVLWSVSVCAAEAVFTGWLPKVICPGVRAAPGAMPVPASATTSAPPARMVALFGPADPGRNVTSARQSLPPATLPPQPETEKSPAPATLAAAANG